MITVGSCVLPTSLTSNSSSTNFNKQNSEGCATTTTTTISDELGGLELGRGAGGGQRRGSQQNCMTKNSSVSDDTLLSRQRGHVTFQVSLNLETYISRVVPSGSAHYLFYFRHKSCSLEMCHLYYEEFVDHSILPQCRVSPL